MNNYTITSQENNPVVDINQCSGNTFVPELNTSGIQSQELSSLSPAEKYEFPTYSNITVLQNTGIGIDTILLKFSVEIEENLFVAPWQPRCGGRRDGSTKVWFVLKDTIDDVNIFMRYYPENYLGKPLLTIEISSLPRLIYGNNTILIYELEEAISLLNEILSPYLQGMNIDTGDGVLERIDFFHDHFVGEFTADYLRAISQAYHPNRTRSIFTNQPSPFSDDANGVRFWATERESVWYDQDLKRGKYGLLRQEVRLLDTDVIEEATGIAQPTLRDFTPEIAFRILKRDLIQCGLWEKNIYGGKLVLQMLKQAFPTKKARELFSILSAIHDNPAMDKKKISEDLGISVWTLNKSLREIKEVDIAPGLLDQDLILPPLTLPVPGYDVSEKSLKVPSNTEIIEGIVLAFDHQSLDQMIK